MKTDTPDPFGSQKRFITRSNQAIKTANHLNTKRRDAINNRDATFFNHRRDDNKDPKLRPLKNAQKTSSAQQRTQPELEAVGPQG